MLTPIDITAVVEYTLKADKGENPITFQLGYFDILLRAQLSKEQAQLRKPGNVKEDAIFAVIKIVRFGIRGWDLKDAEGKPIQLEMELVEVPGAGTYQGVSNKTLSRLPGLSWVNEVANKIMEINYPFHRPQFNEGQFAADHPDLYAKYLTPGDTEKNS